MAKLNICFVLYYFYFILRLEMDRIICKYLWELVQEVITSFIFKLHIPLHTFGVIGPNLCQFFGTAIAVGPGMVLKPKFGIMVSTFFGSHLYSIK